MNYTKPEIVLVASAIATIHGTGKGCIFLETPFPQGDTLGDRDTIGAYEADE